MRRLITRFLFPALALALTLALAPPLAAQVEDPLARLSVSGRGEANAVPDMATISLGVTAEAETAAEALDATSAVAGRILERLEEFSVEPRDVQTSGLSLNPVYSRRDRDNEPPRIIGFRASNQLAVRVRNLAQLGDILGAVTGDGANQFSGLSFSVAEPEALLDEARRDAVADARRKAELYAEAAGVTLGRVLSISEQGVGVPRPLPMAEMRAMAADSVPVAPGETGYTASVAMVFEIIK